MRTRRGPSRRLVRLRRLLLSGWGTVLVVSITILAFAAQRIVSEQAAFSAPSTGRCVPSTLNASDVLPGTSLEVSPLPGSYDALPGTQISLLGVPPAELRKVSVRGSFSGNHPGRLRAYSQGDGASFVPAMPFISGETVTVKGQLTVGAHSHSFSFQFVVAREDVLPHPSTARSNLYPGQKMHFHSRPDLEPPAVVVADHSSQTAPGDIFTAPYNAPGQAGPMIFEESGNLVWFDPLPSEDDATNLQVQELWGKPVLTWWQGYVPPEGFGLGEEIIDNSSYHQIGVVHAGNGHKADLHDFHLTPQGTALLTVFSPIDCDLSSVGGPRGGSVTDAIFQEIDLRTGLVRREWHSLDHVPFAASYSNPYGVSPEWPYDYFHINSVDQLADGTTLISARNTWAMYELNTVTGQVSRTIGGKQSNVKLGSAATAYQHDATELPDGDISVFDNGASPAVHPVSRAVIESIDAGAGTAEVVAQYEHPGAKLSSSSQGNVQTLPNGDIFVGWGSEPYFSEFSSSGELLFDAHFHGNYMSYRAYRSPWTGAPGGSPAAVASTSGGQTTVYVSWNGDTRTTAWRLYAGSSPKHLTPVGTTPRSGFETSIPAPSAAYLAVQALNAGGAVLGTSPTIRG